MGKWIPPHRPLHGERPAGQVVPKLLLLVEGTPDGVDLVAEELIGVYLAQAEVGGDDEHAIGAEDPSELGEGTAKVGPRQVVNGVEGDHGGKRIGQEGERAHITAHEGAPAGSPAGEAEHPEGEVHADHREATTGGQIPTDLSRPTADVEDPTDTGQTVGNRVEYGSVHRKRVEIDSEGGDIVVGHRVIGRPRPRVEGIHVASLAPDDRPIQSPGGNALAVGVAEVVPAPPSVASAWVGGPGGHW